MLPLWWHGALGGGGDAELTSVWWRAEFSMAAARENIKKSSKALRKFCSLFWRILPKLFADDSPSVARDSAHHLIMFFFSFFVCVHVVIVCML